LNIQTSTSFDNYKQVLSKLTLFPANKLKSLFFTHAIPALRKWSCGGNENRRPERAARRMRGLQLKSRLHPKAFDNGAHALGHFCQFLGAGRTLGGTGRRLPGSLVDTVDVFRDFVRTRGRFLDIP